MGIKVTGLNLGHMGMDSGLLGYPNPNDVLLPSRREGGGTKWYRCPSMAYIIEHPAGRILFDTGISTNFAEEWLPEWQGLIDLSEVNADTLLENALKKQGLGPDDFRYVILSHLHADHAGGARIFQDAGAEIVVHEDEHRAVTKVWEAENFFVRKDWNFLSQRSLNLMYGDQEILPDLWTVSLPGHTPGSMGVLLRLDTTGWVLLAGDSVATHGAYGPPSLPNFVNWNNESAAASCQKIEGFAADLDAFIFPGHDETGMKYENGNLAIRQIDFSPGHSYE
jgi:N-acyl homoserine lactone hydrolase